ncbi:hypothetical protein GCM10009555_102990 [Acrocarpospora macrocephala]|uniref:Uncharacterized protein n=1 Tax=Acrocarpospora macrocephala TaxID=150177 RepID=A0A5M3WJK6_9ACTN|nr:hypothetical protein [Acrocarpospora macrocephala]GES07223.1 hypothetical protein Amac_008180 [Acrocarpospora macrocephala]
MWLLYALVLYVRVKNRLPKNFDHNAAVERLARRLSARTAMPGDDHEAFFLGATQLIGLP